MCTMSEEKEKLYVVSTGIFFSDKSPEKKRRLMTIATLHIAQRKGVGVGGGRKRERETAVVVTFN